MTKSDEKQPSQSLSPGVAVRCDGMCTPFIGSSSFHTWKLHKIQTVRKESDFTSHVFLSSRFPTAVENPSLSRVHHPEHGRTERDRIGWQTMARQHPVQETLGRTAVCHSHVLLFFIRASKKASAVTSSPPNPPILTPWTGIIVVCKSAGPVKVEFFRSAPLFPGSRAADPNFPMWLVVWSGDRVW